jgi:hypothetical protein
MGFVVPIPFVVLLPIMSEAPKLQKAAVPGKVPKEPTPKSGETGVQDPKGGF